MAGPQRAHQPTRLTLQAKAWLVLGIFPPEEPRSVNRKTPVMLPVPAQRAAGATGPAWPDPTTRKVQEDPSEVLAPQMGM